MAKILLRRYNKRIYGSTRMAIILMFFSGIWISISNLFMRKSIDHGGTTKGFLVFHMMMGFMVAFLLNPVRVGHYEWSGSIAALGLSAGLILSAILFCLGRALENGPASLTFSILNGSTVMPAILMAALFGAAQGFPYTPWHAMGSLLVLGGLFWAGKGPGVFQNRSAWISYSGALFFAHLMLLVLFQWRALLMNVPQPELFCRWFSAHSIQSPWFMPFMFIASAVVQLVIFLSSERRKPTRYECGYGLVGGAAQGLSTYCMIWATEVATPLENAVIYPIFSIVTIILSNLWGQRLYKEVVNWKACQVCMGGLLVGTVDWSALAAAIGF